MAQPKPAFICYQSSDGWRWRLKARNGCIIADSSEAYTRRIDCLRAIATVRAAVAAADVKAAA